MLTDFRCCVLDPEAVAATGLRDVTQTLRHYLRQDGRLGQLAAGYSIDQIGEVRLETSARIEAYHRIRPPSITGMSVELLNVRVVTPKELAVHERRMRDERWRQEHLTLEYDGEDRNASRMRGYFEDGATAVAGLAAARGELDLNQATQREYLMLQSKRQEMIKLLESLPDAYKDTVAVDVQRIFDSILDQVVDSDAPSAIDGAVQAQLSLDAGPSADAEDGDNGERS